MIYTPHHIIRNAEGAIGWRLIDLARLLSKVGERIVFAADGIDPSPAPRPSANAADGIEPD